METIAEEAQGTTARPIDNSAALRVLATIALLAVVLGLAIQLLIVVVRVLAGGPMPQLATVADVAGGVTWSFVVCTGVGIGVSVMRARAQIVGLLGLVFAPIAVAAAKGSQRLVAAMLELAEQQALLSLGSVSLIRALQYAVLGFLVGTLAWRGEARLSRYLAAWLGVGLVLGGSAVAWQIWLANSLGTPLPPARIAVAAVNDMLFPVGCALVIYCGQLVGRTFSRGELVVN